MWDGCNGGVLVGGKGVLARWRYDGGREGGREGGIVYIWRDRRGFY